MQNKNFRFYSFVAGHYLSALQCGLQTAHAVSEMTTDIKLLQEEKEIFEAWALYDKTIIICQASNNYGVVKTFDTICNSFPTLKLPSTIFYEDEESMNEMATACAIIVPQELYAARTNSELGANKRPNINDNDYVYEFIDKDTFLTDFKIYEADSEEGQFITFLKSFKLA